MLLENFQGDPERELGVLAVDLGQAGACAAVFQGRKFCRDVPLKVIKRDRLYDASESARLQSPAQGVGDQACQGQQEQSASHGLSVEHIKKHLEERQLTDTEVVQCRQKPSTSVQARSSKHDLRRMRLYIAWMIRDWVRLNARQVIHAAEENRCHVIVFESLREFRLPGYEKLDPDEKGRLAMWAFGRIRRKVTEKAVERGMRVVTAPYFRSSQVCWKCGHLQQDKSRWRKNKKKRWFRCECGDSKVRVPERPACQCTEQLNSDANAARVLAKVFWGEIYLPVQS